MMKADFRANLWTELEAVGKKPIPVAGNPQKHFIGAFGCDVSLDVAKTLAIPLQSSE